MVNKKYKVSSVLALLFFVLFGGSVFLNYKLTTYLDEYEDQVERQDSMIKKLTFSSDLVNEYFDIKEDTITHTITYSLKKNKREKEIERITEYSTKYVDPQFIKNGQKMTSDEVVDKFNKLVSDYYELTKKYQAKNDTVIIQGMALGLIKRNYDIDYVSKMNGDLRTVKVFGEKVDSALLLLPYYRHKLSYDPKTKAWIVEYEKIIRKK